MKTGFHIDIYTISDNRNKENIEKFLLKYADRKIIETTKDFEVDILNNSEYRNIKLKSFNGLIELGLSDLKNCFTIYLSSNILEIKSVILSFTEDGKMIFGISIDENNNYEFAKKLSIELKSNNSGIESFFDIESIPAKSMKEFLENIGLAKNKFY